jgi:hypothetical protein
MTGPRGRGRARDGELDYVIIFCWSFYPVVPMVSVSKSALQVGVYNLQKNSIPVHISCSVVWAHLCVHSGLCMHSAQCPLCAFGSVCIQLVNFQHICLQCASKAHMHTVYTCTAYTMRTAYA